MQTPIIHSMNHEPNRYQPEQFYYPINDRNRQIFAHAILCAAYGNDDLAGRTHYVMSSFLEQGNPTMMWDATYKNRTAFEWSLLNDNVGLAITLFAQGAPTEHNGINLLTQYKNTKAAQKIKNIQKQKTRREQ